MNWRKRMGSNNFSTSPSSGDMLKYHVLEISRSIILGARTALIANDSKNRDLIAWGGVIETFDSFIGIYYQDDELYYNLRKKIKTRIFQMELRDATLINRIKIKRLYDHWFKLICVKLAKFKIFPPLPVSYAQGIGEIDEELELVMQNEEIHDDKSNVY